MPMTLPSFQFILMPLHRQLQEAFCSIIHPVTFTSGHAYNIPFSNSMTAGSTGYYIIAVNVAAAATDNHTIKIDGATDPVVFGFTTAPNIIDNQTDAAGAQTIQAADVTLGIFCCGCRQYKPGYEQ